MRASESPFQSYKSKRILSFANLICSSVSGPKALKKTYRLAIFGYSEKLWNVFEIVLEKCEVFVQKSLSLKKYFERKNSQTRFYCLCVNLRTVKFGGQSVKFPMSFGSLQYPLWVNENSMNERSKCVNLWMKALNVSFRRVIFTSGQNLKPPFLCQYLFFFSDFFFISEISFGSLLAWTEKSKFEENCRSEGMR